MDLAILDTKLVETELITTLDKSKRKGTHFWIGATNHKSPSSSQYYWAKTEAPVRKDIKWGGKEPNELHKQKCLKIYDWKLKHKIGNTVCDSQNYPLCQKVIEKDTEWADILNERITQNFLK